MEYQVVYRAALDSAVVRVATDVLAKPVLTDAEREHVSFAVSRGVFTATALRTIRTNCDRTSLPNGCVTQLLHKSQAKPEVCDVQTFGAGADAAALREKQRDAWRAEMRARAEHREYSRLTTSVRPDGSTRYRGDDLPVDPATASAGSGMSSYREQMSLGAGLLFTMLSGVVLGYYMGARLFGWNSSLPWVLGLAGGMGGLMVEGLLLVIRLSKQDAEAAERGGVREGAGAERRPPVLSQMRVEGEVAGSTAAPAVRQQILEAPLAQQRDRAGSSEAVPEAAAEANPPLLRQRHGGKGKG